MNVLLKTRRILMVMLVVLVSLLGLVGEGIGVAYAATTITVTSCPTEAMLIADIASAGAGGTVLFNIASPCTIAITSTLTISQNLTLDNQGQQVTLDGGGTTQVLQVNSGVTFTLNALTIANGSGGSSVFGGGGLFNNGGTVTISNSTFANNTASVSGAFSGTRGGGLVNDGGTVTISNSTFANNTASASGTFSGTAGGGLFNFAGGTVNISNSTFANNTASASGSGSIAQGGGLVNDVGTVNIGQSIVANNTAPVGANCFGTITDQGYNLSNDTSCGFVNGVNHDIVTSNPMLGPLANNGGPTQTLALLSGSPAIDQIPAALCPNTIITHTNTDQRGFPRPDNGESVCDIGAFEFQDPSTPPSPPSPSAPSAPACDISTTKPETFCLNQNGNFTTTNFS